MLFFEKPDNFLPCLEAVGCLVVFEGKILILKRLPGDRLYPNLWGFPSGKIDNGESPLEAMFRELQEETGIRTNGISFLGKVYIVFPRLSFPYYIYRLDLFERPAVKINVEEHVSAKFVSPRDIIEFPHKYIGDTDACIKQFYR